MVKAYFLRCPLCGFSRSFKKYEDLRARFDWDLDNFQIIQAREVIGGGGRGGGNIITLDEGLTIDEAKREIPDILDQIARQCFKIIRKIKG
jgi:hypothetical protein